MSNLQKKNILILEIVLYLLLTVVYYIITREFGYLGFKFSPLTLAIILGFIILSAFSFIGYYFTSDEFSYTIWHFLFIYYFIPHCIYYQFGSGSFNVLFSFIILLTIFLFLPYLNIKINFYRIPIYRSNNIFVYSIITLLLFAPFVYHYIRHIDLSNIMLNNIYETRMLFREINIGLLAYLINPMARVLLPILLVWSIDRKNITGILISIVAFMYIYLCGAFKSHLFGLIMVLFFYHGTYAIKVRRFLTVLIGLSLLAITTYMLADINSFFDVPIRRTLFLPAYLDNLYYDFFSDQKTWWSQNPIGRIFSGYPFGDLPLTQYFGEQVIGKPGLNANVGIFTEGYLSAGFLGVSIHSFILLLVLVYIRGLKIPPQYFGILFIFIFVFNNSFLTTLFITHGLLFFIIIATLFLNNCKPTIKSLFK